MHKTSLFVREPGHRSVDQIGTGHFHTEPGYGTVRDHGTRDWLMIYTVSGSGHISAEGHRYVTKPGDIILWAPGIFHDYRYGSGESWEILWAHFMPWPHWHELMNWPKFKEHSFRFLCIGDRELRAQVYDSLVVMDSYCKGPLRFRANFALHALEKVFLLCSTVNPVHDDNLLDIRIKKAMDYLCEHTMDKISLDQVARTCGLSSSRLSHLFKSRLGITPIQYLEEQRIKTAKSLLRFSPFSIKQIAAMTGFESPFYFTRRFTKYASCSPRDYRKRL